MNIVPFEKFVLNSELNADELIAKLNDSIEPLKIPWFGNFRNSSKLYMGKISEKQFGIRRILTNERNSFIPYVQGRIEEKGKGSEIIITMRLHYIVMLVLLWFNCFLVFGIIKYHEMTPLIFILLIYLMTMYFFNEECSKTKNDLQAMLEADMVHKS